MNPVPDPLSCPIRRHRTAQDGMLRLSADSIPARLRHQPGTVFTQQHPSPAHLRSRFPVRWAARFKLGQFCITPNAVRALTTMEVLKAVARHAAGDWGLLTADDRKQNDAALRRGGRLLSIYTSRAGQRFYVITESSRDLTSIVLPQDY